ncbi:hypothetical protein [Streptomyces nigra]
MAGGSAGVGVLAGRRPGVRTAAGVGRRVALPRPQAVAGGERVGDELLVTARPLTLVLRAVPAGGVRRALLALTRVRAAGWLTFPPRTGCSPRRCTWPLRPASTSPWPVCGSGRGSCTTAATWWRWGRRSWWESAGTRCGDGALRAATRRRGEAFDPRNIPHCAQNIG